MVSRTLVTALALFLVACNKPVDPQKTSRAVDWLENYYSELPLGGGWRVEQIYAEDHYLIVSIRIPDRSASGIVEYDIERQWRILSVSCPNEYEDIWNIIDTNHIIEVQFSSPGMGEFSHFDCREIKRYL